MAAHAQKGPSRAALLIPFAALIGAAVLHAAYWFYAANQIEQVALDWIEEQEAAGYAVEHRGIKVVGYPFRFSLRAEAPRLTAPPQEGGWTAAVERLAATAQFYDLNHWIVTPDGQAEVLVDERSYRAAADSARLSLRAQDGVTRRIGASVENLTIAGQGDPPPGVQSITRLVMSGFLDEADQLAIRLQVEGVGIGAHVIAESISNEFGDQVGLARLDVSVSQWNALARVADPEEWRRAEGEMIINQAQLIWGPAELSGDGEIGLDGNLLPDGRLSVVVTDPDTLIGALEASGLVYGEQANALRLAALVAPRREGGIAMAFRLQDGGVFLGPARIGNLVAPEAN